MIKAFSRTEAYLRAIATGSSEGLPKPRSRKEYFLRAIAERTPSGGSVDPSAITDAVNDYLDEHPVSGADVPATDIDFSNWEGGNE